MVLCHVQNLIILIKGCHFGRTKRNAIVDDLHKENWILGPVLSNLRNLKTGKKLSREKQLTKKLLVNPQSYKNAITKIVCKLRM